LIVISKGLLSVNGVWDYTCPTKRRAGSSFNLWRVPKVEKMILSKFFYRVFEYTQSQKELSAGRAGLGPAKPGAL
jgi:hypothetical protein